MMQLTSIQSLWAVVILIGIILFIAFEFLPLMISELGIMQRVRERKVKKQAANMDLFNAALEEEGIISKKYGHNSKELMKAKKVSMELWKKVVDKK